MCTAEFREGRGCARCSLPSPPLPVQTCVHSLWLISLRACSSHREETQGGPIHTMFFLCVCVCLYFCFYVILFYFRAVGIEPRTLRMQAKCSAPELHLQPPFIHCYFKKDLFWIHSMWSKERQVALKRHQNR